MHGLSMPRTLALRHIASYIYCSQAASEIEWCPAGVRRPRPSLQHNMDVDQKCR